MARLLGPVLVPAWGAITLSHFSPPVRIHTGQGQGMRLEPSTSTVHEHN